MIPKRRNWLYCMMVLGALASGLPVHAQQASDLGTKTPYLAPAGKYVPAPAGYVPVFIDYVGRHGARFLTKAGADLRIAEALEAAGKRQALLPAGARIAKLAAVLTAAGQQNYENITMLGVAEQEGIGQRMRAAYAPVFTGKGLEVVVTWKKRTVQSAEAFLEAFSSGAPYGGKVRMRQAPDTADAVLRYYDLSPGYLRYKKGKQVRAALDSLERDPRTAEGAARICRKLFRPAYAEELIRKGEAVNLAENLYDLYSIQFSMTEELRARGLKPDPAAWAAVLDKQDLDWLAFRNGAADFMEKGPGLEPGGIQVRVAVPLLVDFIRSMDEVVAGQAGADAVLRFTHAEAIAPFAALLGISGASAPGTSVFTYRNVWQAESVIPLSANIQWILYSNGKDWLVRVLLNEREVRLPVAADAAPYYRWEDVRKYYLELLTGLHTGPEADMIRYLRELR